MNLSQLPVKDDDRDSVYPGDCFEPEVHIFQPEVTDIWTGSKAKISFFLFFKTEKGVY